MLWRGHYSYCVQGLGRSWMSVSYNVPRFLIFILEGTTRSFLYGKFFVFYREANCCIRKINNN